MRNIKSAIAAAGLFFVACCVPTAAAAPQPSFADEPAPSSYTARFQQAKLVGIVSADEIKVCALRLLENIKLMQAGVDPISPLVDVYADTYKIAPEQRSSLKHSCDMFDAGVVFYSAITSPSADAKPRGIPKDEI